MNNSASQILWSEAGRPEPKKDLEAVETDDPCLICGYRCESMYRTKDAIPRTETGHDHFVCHESEGVCAGCIWVSGGRWKDQFRLWSIVYCENGGLADHYSSVYEQYGDHVDYSVRVRDLVEGCDDRVQITCRGDLREAARLLMDPPACRWFVSIADSGKKQVIRHADVNRGDDYSVRFELQDVSFDSETAVKLYDVATKLKADGWSNQNILTGDPSTARAWKLSDKLPRYHGLINKIRYHLKSPQLELVLFTLTEETLDDIRQTTNRNCGGGAPDGRSRAIRSPADGDDPARPDSADEALGLGAEGASSRRGEGSDLRADVERSLRHATDEGTGDPEKTGQGSLFAWGDAENPE